MPSHLLVFPSRGSHGYLSHEILTSSVLDCSYACNLSTRYPRFLKFPIPVLRPQTDLVVDCHFFAVACNMPSHLLVFPSRGSHGYVSHETGTSSVLDCSHACKLLTRVPYCLRSLRPLACYPIPNGSARSRWQVPLLWIDMQHAHCHCICLCSPPPLMSDGYLVFFELILRYCAAVKLCLPFILSIVPCSVHFNTPHPYCPFGLVLAHLH
jgi:hypothetical protein